MSSKYEINYGWCYTDHKDGKEILDFYRDFDYVFGKEYSATTQGLLKDLGFPIPDISETYRGRRHDLLMVDSHGLIVRIGKTDIEDLMNPFVLQPIGWKQAEGITVAVYPGVETAEQVYPYYGHTKLYDIAPKFQENILKSGTKYIDKYTYNLGVVRTQINNGKDNNTLVVIDTDNMAIRNSQDLKEKKVEALQRNYSRFENKADAVAATFYEIYGNKRYIQDNMAAFEKHHSLRRTFFDACKGDTSDKVKLGKLWDKCYEMVDVPKSATFPVWKNVGGVLKSSDITVNNLKLYNNWTKTPNRKKSPVVCKVS